MRCAWQSHAIYRASLIVTASLYCGKRRCCNCHSSLNHHKSLFKKDIVLFINLPLHMMTAISDIGVVLIRKIIFNPVTASVYHHLSINQNKTFIKIDIVPFIKSPLHITTAINGTNGKKSSCAKEEWHRGQLGFLSLFHMLKSFIKSHEFKQHVIDNYLESQFQWPFTLWDSPVVHEIFFNPVTASIYHHSSINHWKTSIKTDIVPLIKSLFTYHDSYQRHLQKIIVKSCHVHEEKVTEATLASRCYSACWNLS